MEKGSHWNQVLFAEQEKGSGDRQLCPGPGTGVMDLDVSGSHRHKQLPDCFLCHETLLTR